MIFSHTISSVKKARSDSLTKFFTSRFLNRADVSKNNYIDASSFFKRQIIEQFRLHREIANHTSFDIRVFDNDDNTIRRRKFYTRKQKLKVIAYVTIL
jgi:hypothetical protein